MVLVIPAFFHPTADGASCLKAIFFLEKCWEVFEGNMLLWLLAPVVAFENERVDSGTTKQKTC